MFQIAQYFRKNQMLFCRCGPKGSNFGDLFGPWLYDKITGGKKLVLVDQKQLSSKAPSKSILVTCGSLLHPKLITGNSVVWGSGVISRTFKFSTKPLKVCAVRGPISRRILLASGIDCPEVYGDPGVLAPRYFKPNKSHSFKVGLIPHFVCYPRVLELFAHRANEVLVIDVDRPVEDVIRDIAACEVTFSSSLHGIILSHAYGVPCMWMEPALKPLVGDGVKYHDYYMSVGYSDGEVSPGRFDSLTKLSEDALRDLAFGAPAPKGGYPFDTLLESCPFNDR
jgi:pyruvyltransferase